MVVQSSAVQAVVVVALLVSNVDTEPVYEAAMAPLAAALSSMGSEGAELAAAAELLELVALVGLAMVLKFCMLVCPSWPSSCLSYCVSEGLCLYNLLRGAGIFVLKLISVTHQTTRKRWVQRVSCQLPGI